MRGLVVVFAWLALAVPAAAQQARLLSAPPAGFTVTPTTRPQFDFGIGLDPVSGQPPKAGTGPHLCEAGFKASASNAQLSQKQLNAMLGEGPWRDLLDRTIGTLFEIESARRIGFGKGDGIELKLRPRAGPDHENVRLLMSITETPRGRTTFMCATTRSAWSDALPTFRAVRRAIVAP